MKKIIFKEFPNTETNFSRFNTNTDWKLQFIEWDIELDKIDTQDSNFHFRDANIVFKKYSKKSTTFNDAGIINVFYDNSFQFATAIAILVHGIVYGIL